MSASLLIRRPELVSQRHGALFSKIERLGIQVHDKPAIAGHLERYPELEDCLAGICAKATGKIGDAQWVLEVYRSMEDEDETLTLLARQTVYAPDLTARLDALAEELAERFSLQDAFLHITTDFQKPGDACNGL